MPGKNHGTVYEDFLMILLEKSLVEFLGGILGGFSEGTSGMTW